MSAINPVEANVVDCRGGDVDSTVFKRCGVVEEYSSLARYGVDSRLFMLDVVAAGLLMLEEVVDLLLDVGMLVMRKGVEANRWVVGFKAVVVVNAIISVDGLTEDTEDKR